MKKLCIQDLGARTIGYSHFHVVRDCQVHSTAANVPQNRMSQSHNFCGVVSVSAMILRWNAVG